MFRRVHEYPVLSWRGVWRPRAYGDLQQDGLWDGWLVFFPLAGGLAIAPPTRETSQSHLDALTIWAAGVTPIYLQGALDRALEVAERPAVINQLATAEYEALEDAARLETVAAVDRTAAQVSDAAADAARADAETLRRERLAAEQEIAATEEIEAKVEAKAHEAAARDANAIAADAGRRRHAAEPAGTAPKPTRRRTYRRKRR